MGQKEYNSIAEWLRSDSGKNALKHDEFQLNGFEEMVKAGKHIHDLQSSIAQYARIMNTAGYGDIHVVADDKTGTKIVFRPTNKNENLPDDECPTLDIGRIENGFKNQNKMMTANNPVAVRGANGNVGLASSLSTGIAVAAEEIEKNFERWKKEVRNLSTRAQKIRSTTRIKMNAVTHLNPSLYSPHQINDYTDTLSQSDMSNLALEGQEMIKSLILTGFYTESVFNAHAKNMKGRGAPKNEKDFASTVQDIIDAARGSKNFQTLDSYVKKHYQWIYDNVWEGDLANFFKQVAGKITQGGKKEGAPGIIGVAEADVPLSSFANYGRKIKQNLQYIKRDSTYGKPWSHASGITRFHTLSQYALYDKVYGGKAAGDQKIAKDVYYAGELTDEDLKKVYQRLKKERSRRQAEGKWTAEEEKKFQEQAQELAMSGFGKDASLMSRSANGDFTGRIKLKGGATQEEVDRSILELLEKEIAAQNAGQGLSEKEISDKASLQLKGLQGAKKKKKYNEMIKRALGSIYGLDSSIKIKGYKIGKDANGRITYHDLDLLNPDGVMAQLKTLKGEVPQERVNEIVLDRLKKKISKEKANKTLDEKEIANKASQQLEQLMGGKDHRKYNNMVKDALRSIYNLTDLVEIIGYDEDKGPDGKTVYRNINTKKILDNYVFTARGDETSDFRSVISNFEDELLGLAYEAHGYRKEDIYIDPDDPSKGLKMHIARQAAPINEKSIRNEILRKSQYVFNRASGVDPEEIKNALKRNGLEGVFNYDESTGRWYVDNAKADKKFFHPKGNGGAGTPFKFLQNVIKLGQDIKVETGRVLTLADGTKEKEMAPIYEGGDVFDIKKDGTIEYKKFLPDAMGVQVSSVDRYQGLAGETHSRAKFGWRELQSLEGTVAEMEALGSEYEKGVAPVRELSQKIASKLAEKGVKYQSHRRNLGFLAYTFNNNADQAKKDLRGNDSVVWLDRDELMGLDASSKYETIGTETGVNLGDNPDLAFNNYINDLRKAQYKKLLGKYGEEGLRKHEIFSSEDIQVAFDLGDDRIGHIGDDGQLYSSGVAVFGVGNLSKPKKGSSLYMPDDIAIRNNAIARALQDYYNYTGSDQQYRRSSASRKILESTEKIAESIERGSTYDSFHELTDDDASGWLLFKALNNFSSDIFSDLYGIEAEKTPDMIMSTVDAKAMYEAMSREELVARYEEAFGKGAASKKKSRKLIKELLDAYDVSSGHYKGQTVTSEAFNRSPTIKFVSDIIGGRLAYSSDRRIVNQGTLAINRDLAASSHGDMDGDRVAFFNAFAAGDYEGASEALMRYYRHLREAQTKTRLKEEKEQEEDGNGSVIKANSVADLAQRRQKAVGANAGAKGAGIFGNLLFGVQNILRDNAMSQGDKALNPEAAFVGNFAQNLAHVLYQEGINIKNLKIAGRDISEEEVELYTREMMTLAGQSHTWDTWEGMSVFLKKLENLGIAKNGRVFSGEIIANMGLMDIGKDSPELEVLSKIADRAAKNVEKLYSKKSPEWKNVKKDIDRIKLIKEGKAVGIEDLSNELLNALITDNVFGAASYFSPDSKKGSLGHRINSQYEYIPGHTHEFARLLRGAREAPFDEVGEKAFRDILEQKVKREGRNDYSSEYLDLVDKKVKLSDFTTSPSAMTSRQTPYYSNNESKDTRELLDQLDKASKGDSAAIDYLRRQADIDDYRPVLEGTWGGSLAHAAAEAQRTPEGDDREAKLKALNELKEKTASRLKELKLSYYVTDAEINHFVEENVKKGLINAAYVDAKIKSKGGKALGNEIALAGFVKGKNDNEALVSNQFSDYIYTTVGEDGKTTIHVGDYKNVKKGAPSVANIMQAMDYVESLRLLHNSILDSDSETAYTYLNSDKASNIQKGWARRIEAAAKGDVKYLEGQGGYEMALRLARDKRFAEFEKLYDVLSQGEVRFAAELVSHGVGGTISTHNINLSDATLNGVFKNRYHKESATPLTQEEEEQILKNANIVKTSDTEWADKGVVARELERAFGGIVRDIAEKMNLIERLKILKKDEERKVDSDAEKITKYDSQIKEAEEALSGGYTGDPDKFLEEIDKLQSEIDKAKPGEDTTQQTRALSKYRGSLLYKGAHERMAWAQKGEIVAANGSRFKITEDVLAAALNPDTTDERLYGQKINKELKTRLATDAYISSIKKRRDLYKKSIYMQLLGGSEYLTDDQKEDARINASELAAELSLEGTRQKDAEEDLLNDKGEWKEGVNEDRLRAYHLNQDDKDRIKKETSRQFKLDEWKKGKAFFDKAYGVYKSAGNLDNQIWKTRQDIENPENKSAQEIAILQAELDNLLEQRAFMGEMLPEIEGYEGYTKAGNEKAKKKADLENNLWKLKHTKNGRYVDNAESPVDFLGIDSTTMSWSYRMISGGLLATGLQKIKKALSDIVNKAKQLDSAVTNLRIVTGESQSGAKDMVDSYSELAEKLGVTTTEVTSAATEWLRQGYNVAEVNDLVQSSMYLSKLGMIDSTTATKDLTSAMKGFKMEASEAMSIVDKLTALDVDAATSAGDIAEGLSEFANIATTSGVNLDQAAAYVATIADVTQQSGSSVGTALKTILSRYSNVKASAYNSLNLDSTGVDASDNSLNDVEKVLNKLGVSMRDTNLEFRDFDDVLDDIADKWGTLDNVSKKAIANAFAGSRQQEDFLVLLENYDSYKGFLETSQNATGTAETKYQSYLDSYTAAKNEMTAVIEGLVNSSGFNKLLTDLTKIGTGLINVLEKVFKYLPTIAAGVIGFRALQGRSVLNYAGEALSKQLKTGSWAEEGSIGRGLSELFGKRKSKKHRKGKEQEATAEEKTEAEEQEAIEEEKVEAEEQEVAFKEKIAKIAAEEAANKEAVADQANLEALEKAGVVTKAQLEEAKKNGVLTDAELEQAQKQGTLSYSSLEKMEKANLLDDAKLEAAYKDQVKEAAQQEASVSNASVNGAANDGDSKDSLGLKLKSNYSSLLSGFSMLSAGITSAVTQFSTAATTHKYNGETVESSENAQKLGATSASILNLFSGIPIIGTVLGTIGTAVADHIAGAYDEERDRANAQTSEANKNISSLNSLNTSLSAIGDADWGTTEFYDSIESFAKEIFAEDSEDTRALLQQYLGGDTSIYDVLSRIKENTEDSADAYRELRLAQLKAEKAQIGNKYASQLYNSQTSTNDTYADYAGYKMSGAGVGTGIGVGLASTAAGAGAGALIAGGMVGLGVVNSWNPVGWVLLIAGAIAGAGVGIKAGIDAAEAKNEESRQKYAENSDWREKTNAERIVEVTEQVNAARAEIDEEGNAEIVANGEKLLAALEEQISITNQMLDEMDDITLQEALISAKVEGKDGNSLYLEDASKAQLKDLGIDEILLAYAKAIEESGGLYDQEIWEDAEHTTLSDSGRSYVMAKLRKQGDEEINAVLSGEVYTLNEILKLRDKYGETKWVTDLMKNFATSLGVTVDELERVKDKYGDLTYSETLMTSTELQSRVGDFMDLVGDIVSGAGKASEWMNTIVSEFPELIAYMSDTPTLLGKITEKLRELSEVAIQAQYNDVIDSETYFSTVEDDFYAKLLKENGGSEAEELLKSSTSMSSFSDVISWLKGQYNADTGELSAEGKAVYNTLMATLEGTELTSDYLKDYYDQIIEAQTTVYDNEINNLTAQKEALEQINSQREYENKLIEAKLKLEDAQKEKKRVYRMGVGWVYESDQEAVLEAQENLTSVENEKTVSSLEAQIAELEREKEKVSNIYSEQNAENLQKLYESFVDGLAGKGSDNVFAAIKDGIGGISYALNDLINKDLNGGFSNKEEALSQLQTDWENLQKQPTNSKEYNTALAKYQETMSNAKKVGVTESDISSYGGLSGTTKTVAGDKTAWEAGQSSDYNKMKYDIIQTVLLTDPDSPTKKYSGEIKLSEAQYSTTVLGDIFDNIKKGKAILWDSKGNALKTKNDARLAYDKTTDTNFLTYLQRILQNSSFSSGNFIIGSKSGENAVYVDSGGGLHPIVGTKNIVKSPKGSAYIDDETGEATFDYEDVDETNYNGLSVVSSSDGWHWLQDTVQEAAATGALDIKGSGKTLINEFGTEAIVTPSGTITALPSHTGIIPADITKNLWELGEIAPAISRTLMTNMIPDRLQQNSLNSTTDESLNVNTLNITMNPDGSFDVDKFVSDLKSRVALTKNLNR